MSFVPTPQQANAASPPSNNGVTSLTTSVGGPAAAAAGTTPEASSDDLLFKMRTFDVFWVDKEALMYRDGIAKVNISQKILKKSYSRVNDLLTVNSLLSNEMTLIYLSTRL